MSETPAAPGAAHARALAALHVAVLLFGFAGLFGKWIALPAVTIVLGRAGIAAFALALLRRFAQAARRDGATGGFDWRLASGGAVLALHWVAFFEAIHIATVAVALLGFASFPLFVLLLEALTRQRRLRGGEWATAALVTAGLLLLVPEFRLGNRIVQGLLWGVLSGFTFALLAVANRALAARHAPEAIALSQNACAAVLLLPLALAASAIPSARDLALLVVLGVACTALAHTLFIRSLGALSAHTASVVAALEPVYGIGLAFALLGEPPSLRTLAGAALIVGAALLATRASLR
ncbi:MAG TPA: DMT family transporter [Casimicrobiaceae bacterium]|nr:DMT family transporter [Casimicrobiaceae bacterium]